MDLEHWFSVFGFRCSGDSLDVGGQTSNTPGLRPCSSSGFLDLVFSTIRSRNNKVGAGLIETTPAGSDLGGV
jgi:hypothetical protein